MSAEALKNNETTETAPGADLMDLDFTAPAESPAEVAQAEKDKADVAAALAKANDSYDWDSANQRRAGFN